MLLLRILAIVLRLIVNFVFWVLGFIVVTLAVNKTEVRLSKYYPGRPVRVFTPWWAWVWSNEENGVDGLTGSPPDGYLEKIKGWGLKRIIWVWSAWRNPQNNLRYVPILSPSYDSTQIKSRTWGDGNYFITQGIYSSLRLHVFGLRFWIGWKYYLGDESGIPAGDNRTSRADFAFQLKRWND